MTLSSNTSVNNIYSMPIFVNHADVIGRKWVNVDIKNFKLIIENIIKKLEIKVITIDIDINTRTGGIALTEIHSIDDSIVEQNSIHHSEFGDFIKTCIKTNKEKIRLHFNNEEYFW